MTQTPQTPMYEPEHHHGMTIGGLVLGILSISIFWFLGLGLLLGIIGVIVSAVALNRSRTRAGFDASEAKAGLTTSIVGSILGLLLLIGAVAGMHYVDWANWGNWMNR